MSGRIGGAIFAAVCLFCVALTAGAVTARDEANAERWNFKVYLDDSEIGYHNFLLTKQAGRQQLTTEAAFKVKFLFVTAYKYEHFNEETWRGNCLQEIRSETDVNGKKFAVRGSQRPDGFEVEAGNGRNEVDGCVKSFAYWNPDILDEPQLLNSQTGELLPVTIEPVAVETLTVRGEETPAQRYKLLAKNIELDIWYSEDRRWLALESTVKGGRKLRYELT